MPYQPSFSGRSPSLDQRQQAARAAPTLTTNSIMKRSEFQTNSYQAASSSGSLVNLRNKLRDSRVYHIANDSGVYFNRSISPENHLAVNGETSRSRWEDDCSRSNLIGEGRGKKISYSGNYCRDNRPRSGSRFASKRSRSPRHSRTRSPRRSRTRSPTSLRRRSSRRSRPRSPRYSRTRSPRKYYSTLQDHCPENVKNKLVGSNSSGIPVNDNRSFEMSPSVSPSHNSPFKSEEKSRFSKDLYELDRSRIREDRSNHFKNPCSSQNVSTVRYQKSYLQHVPSRFADTSYSETVHLSRHQVSTRTETIVISESKHKLHKGAGSYYQSKMETSLVDEVVSSKESKERKTHPQQPSCYHPSVAKNKPAFRSFNFAAQQKSRHQKAGTSSDITDAFMHPKFVEFGKLKKFEIENASSTEIPSKPKSDTKIISGMPKSKKKFIPVKEIVPDLVQDYLSSISLSSSESDQGSIDRKRKRSTKNLPKKVNEKMNSPSANEIVPALSQHYLTSISSSSDESDHSNIDRKVKSPPEKEIGTVLIKSSLTSISTSSAEFDQSTIDRKVDNCPKHLPMNEENPEELLKDLETKLGRETFLKFKSLLVQDMKSEQSGSKISVDEKSKGTNPPNPEIPNQNNSARLRCAKEEDIPHLIPQAIVSDETDNKSSSVCKKKKTTKKKLNELDRLHNDINEMNDRDLIVSSGGPRACTKLAKAQGRHLDVMNCSGFNAEPNERPKESNSYEDYVEKFKLATIELKINKLDLHGAQMPIKLNQQFVSKHPELKTVLAPYLKERQYSPSFSDESVLSEDLEDDELRDEPIAEQFSTIASSSKTIVTTSPSKVVKVAKSNAKSVNSPLKEVKPQTENSHSEKIPCNEGMYQECIKADPEYKVIPVRKRASNWSLGIISKKAKKPKTVNTDNDWQDIIPKIIERKNLPHKMKMKLSKFIDFMDKCDQKSGKIFGLVKSDSKPADPLSSATVRSVSFRPTCSHSLTFAKQNLLTVNSDRSMLQHSAPKLISSNRISNFSFMDSRAGKLMKCELCSFESISEESFTQHIKCSHPLNVWSKFCQKCNKMTEVGDDLVSEFHHMIMHMNSDENNGINFLDKTSASVAAMPLITVRSLPGDKLSKASQAATNLKNSISARIMKPPTSDVLCGKVIAIANTSDQLTKLLKLSNVSLGKPVSAPKCYESPKTSQLLSSNQRRLSTSLSSLLHKAPKTSTVGALLETSPSVHRLDSSTGNSCNPNKAFVIRPWLKDSEDMKSAENCQEMIKNTICLAALYKCMGSTCSFFTSVKNVFEQHLNFHEKRQIADRLNYLMCSYCNFVSDSIGELTQHVITAHAYDKFQCRYCFYRAYSNFHVFYQHHRSFHKNEAMRSIIDCDTGYSRIPSKELDAIKLSIPKLVPQIKCVCKYLK